MKNRTMLAAVALVIGAPFLASAQAPVCVIDGQRRPPSECGATGGAPEDPLARFLFPPELVMAHQQEINLTDRQRNAIRDAIKDAQAKFVDMQFQMSAETEKLQRLIQSTSPDEPRVLDQVDRLLSIERDVKRAQITLMIRVKNQLTEEQQATLNKLRKSYINLRVF
jgi:Spy/CpxP family protein refolding chaperone